MRAHEFVTEKKKRKRKPRWAAYGPGPFGGYGFAAGYSGDAGGDGGVGEASYDGNIGAMEVFKFMNTASSFEKDLLKKLIAQKAYAKAWALVQGVTGTKLKGKEFEVEEGWKDWVAGAALGSAVAFGGGAAEANVEKVQVSRGDTVYSIAKAFDTTPQIIQKLNKLDKEFTIKPGQTIKVPAGEIVSDKDEPSKEKKAEPEADSKSNIEVTKADLEDSVTGRKLEVFFRKYAESQGIKGAELTHLMAQADVETDHFKTLKEYGSNSYFKMYEPVYRKDKKTGKLIMDPDTKNKKPKHFNVKAKRLGNFKKGDGARYKGRGFLQVTGRYNYRVVGEKIGVNLEKDPEILEKDPIIAAKASLAYWEIFVKPNIKNFKNVKDVTGEINPGLKHLQKRKDRHQEYKVAFR